MNKYKVKYSFFVKGEMDITTHSLAGANNKGWDMVESAFIDLSGKYEIDVNRVKAREVQDD